MTIYSKLSALWQMLWGTKSRRKTLLLLFSNFLSLFLGVCINLIVTRYLGVEAYSNYALLIAIFTLSATLINFGCFHAVNRAIVTKKYPVIRREYYAVLLSELLIWSCLSSIVLAIYSFVDPVFAKRGLNTIFLCLCLPGSAVFLCTKAFDSVLNADNRIYSIAASHVFPRIILLTGIIICYFVFPAIGKYKLPVACSLYIFAFGVIYLLIFCIIKPKFTHCQRRWFYVWNFWKKYGFNLYIAGLFTVGSNRLTPILIGYLCKEQSAVGFFTLATFFTAPLLLIPNTIAISNFERFSRQERLSWRNLMYSLFISIIGLILLLTILPVFFRFFYPEEFFPVVSLSYFVAVAYLLWGMADFFERFVSAHGKSKAIRNIYLCVGITSCGLNILLIPSYGAVGAAVALIGSSVVYLCSIMIYCYCLDFLPVRKKSVLNR